MLPPVHGHPHLQDGEGDRPGDRRSGDIPRRRELHVADGGARGEALHPDVEPAVNLGDFVCVPLPLDKLRFPLAVLPEPYIADDGNRQGRRLRKSHGEREADAPQVVLPDHFCTMQVRIMRRILILVHVAVVRLQFLFVRRVRRIREHVVVVVVDQQIADVVRAQVQHRHGERVGETDDGRLVMKRDAFMPDALVGAGVERLHQDGGLRAQRQVVQQPAGLRRPAVNGLRRLRRLIRRDEPQAWRAGGVEPAVVEPVAACVPAHHEKP